MITIACAIRRHRRAPRGLPARRRARRARSAPRSGLIIEVVVVVVVVVVAAAVVAAAVVAAAVVAVVLRSWLPAGRPTVVFQKFMLDFSSRP